MKTKTPTTTALVTCRRHWVAYIIPGIISAFTALMGIAVLVEGDAYGILMIVVAAAIIGLSYIFINSSHLTLSEDSIEGKTGIIKTVKMVSPISKVQDVSVRSGLFGKIFGYSTITVSTSGSAITEYVFAGVTNASEFQQKYIEIANK